MGWSEGAYEGVADPQAAAGAGRQGGRSALGCSRIVDLDGVVLAEADPGVEALLVAEVEGQRRVTGPRGWDGHLNPAVADAFTALWRPEDG